MVLHVPINPLRRAAMKRSDRFLVYQNTKGFSCSKCGKEFSQAYEKAVEQFDAHVCSMQRAAPGKVG